MPPHTEIKLVVFDLGGVLIRLAPSWRDAFEHAGVAYAHPLDHPPVRARLRQLIDLEEVGALGTTGFFGQAAPLLGITPSELVRVSDAYLRGAFPSVHDLIQELAAGDTATACLSNTNHNHWKDLTNPDHPNGLPLHRLDYRFASQLVGHRKPDPAIYRHLEQATGFTGPQIFFFDDLAINTEAAAQLGWRTHRVESPDDTVTEIRQALRAQTSC